jgi:hypothetical protein
MGRVPREGQGPTAQHRLTSRRTQAALRHTVDIVDLRTGTIHLLTSAAVAAGTNRAGRYVALCGADIIRTDDLSPIPDSVTTAKLERSNALDRSIPSTVRYVV